MQCAAAQGSDTIEALDLQESLVVGVDHLGDGSRHPRFGKRT
jgi:hypothetical protein